MIKEGNNFTITKTLERPSKIYIIKKCKCGRLFASYNENETDCGCQHTFKKRKHCECCFKYFEKNNSTGSYCSEGCYWIQYEADYKLITKMLDLGGANKNNCNVFKKRKNRELKLLRDFEFSLSREVKYMYSLKTQASIDNYLELFDIHENEFKRWMSFYKTNLNTNIPINEILFKRIKTFRLEQYKFSNKFILF